jgi:hypothetical protein
MVLRSLSVAAWCAVKECRRTFKINILTKKEIYARWIMPLGVLEGGTRCKGCVLVRS